MGTARKCTNHYPPVAAPLATRRVGAREYCDPCALQMIAFVASLRAHQLTDEDKQP